MQIYSTPRADLQDNFNVIAEVLSKYDVLKFQLGAEVGVRHGFFSEHLLKLNPELTLYLVDPYLPYLDLEYQFTQEEQDEIKERAKERLAPFGDRAVWMYLSSKAAAEACPDHMLDFVFIDAEHSYGSAREDLHAWYTKVKLGGLICGHDFGMEGVQKAVKEFAGHLAKDIFHVSGTADTWYIFL